MLNLVLDMLVMVQDMLVLVQDMLDLVQDMLGSACAISTSRETITIGIIFISLQEVGFLVYTYILISLV